MTVPALAAHIEIYQSIQNGVTIYNSNTDKTYSIGDKEARVLSLLDGKRTIHQLHQICDFYSEEELALLIEAFAELGAFEKRKKRFNPLKMKIRLWNPNKVFKTDSGLTMFSHSIVFTICPILFVLGAAVTVLMRLFGTEQPQFLFDAAQLFRSVTILDCIVLVIGTVLSFFLHETAHAVSARRYDVNVPEIGVMLYCLFPCAYTNVSGIHLLSDRSQKIKVLVSGTMANLGIIGILQMLLVIWPTLLTNPAFIGLLLINLSTIIMNTMVFLKFDGYYILEAMTDTPQLQKISLEYFRILAAGKGQQVQGAGSIDPADQILYVVFGLASVIFAPIVMLNAVLPLIQILMR